MNNINDILAKLKEKISCNSACQKKRTAAELKQKWVDAEKRANHSNEDIELAKKNYYIFTGGQPAYTTKKRSEYIQNTSDYEKNELMRNEELTKEIKELLERYALTNEHIHSSTELLNIKENENKLLEKKIDEYEKLTFTSQRKVVYENHDMTRIITYNKIIIFIYYGLFIYYLTTGNFFSDTLYKEPKICIIMLIYLLIPFSMHWIVKQLFDIKDTISYFFNNKMYKNVYTNI